MHEDERHTVLLCNWLARCIEPNTPPRTSAPVCEHRAHCRSKRSSHIETCRTLGGHVQTGESCHCWGLNSSAYMYAHGYCWWNGIFCKTNLYFREILLTIQGIILEVFLVLSLIQYILIPAWAQKNTFCSRLHVPVSVRGWRCLHSDRLQQVPCLEINPSTCWAGGLSAFTFAPNFRTNGAS